LKIEAKTPVIIFCQETKESDSQDQTLNSSNDDMGNL
jgi:hypothetical protein